MRDSRLCDFPWVLALLGVTLAGCAEVENGREIAMGPAHTVPGDAGVLDTGNTGGQGLPGMAPAGETPPAGHPAAQAVLRMAQEAMAVLSDASLSEDQRAEKLRHMMARDIDIPPIARFVLGRFWRGATERQREAYVAAYSDYILRTYAARIGGGGAAVDRFDVIRTQVRGTKDFLVHCVVARAGGESIRLVWRLRQRDGHYRIIDMMVEGVSLAQTQRQEFVSFIRANGGNVDKLIAELRQRTI
ncbi:MAG: phospholipid-binding protein MlaC [Rhodospirillales bacterium]